MKLTLLLITLTLRLLAPDPGFMLVPEAESINPYKPIIWAIGKVECNFDTLAYNAKEDAVGYYQIRQVRLDDYEKRTGIHYDLSEMYDYWKAEKVFYHYAVRIGYRDAERISREWNGGMKIKQTIGYWEKVKRHL